VRAAEAEAITEALGRPVAGTRPLAGGFSHETCLLTLAGGDRVVVRLGGADPAIEAAVMARGRERVPVPRVLLALSAASDGVRPAMVLEYVAGTPLSTVLADGGEGMAELGAEVGRVIANVGAVPLGRPGFFGDRDLGVREMPP
jgi:aminoglycoside phosphotransferase (APT) family kinase protein